MAPRARSADTRQGSLLVEFEAVGQPPGPAEGSLDIAAELCAALARAIKDCPLSRAEIAARMSDLTGKAITEAMLNSWTSKAHDGWRFPFEFAPAFEVATGSQCLQLLLARKRGTLIMTPRDGRDAEIGRLQREIRADKQRLRDLLGGGV
ncbi:hypothetical protein D3874_03225 [Oleomonas cavernae]|uniref:Uncharacterized protein n=1 Tax=Oleomonas cavernae TaxID=2320859 RepID=A0A418WU99_9PROT|nr:hypothetical protein [Oleomonas cavernae]RJF94840.1 hypothetical protein D3874_03225 [Oleomonas cavernae]